jgi:hypothetical protein
MNERSWKYCPKCEKLCKVKVLRTWDDKEGCVRRRKNCLECGNYFVTREVPDQVMLHGVKYAREIPGASVVRRQLKERSTERTSRSGRRWREAVLSRDHHICRLCLNIEDLKTHHIQRYTDCPEVRWYVINGITLCASCHAIVTNHEQEYAPLLQLLARLSTDIAQDATCSTSL